MVAVVGRPGWGAPTPIPAGRHVPPGARHWFVVHWPGSAVGPDPAQVIRNIDASHRRQGWAVIGYNFLVSRDGRIWEGCGRDVRGIHSPPRNTDGWGVCCLVSVGEAPPQPMLAATRALYDWLCGVAGRRLGMASHSTHFATQCAGPALNAWVASGMPGGGPAPPPTLPPPPGVIVPPGTPPWPGRILRQPPIMRGEDVRTWQRGAGGLATDGAYGPLSEGRCRQIQQAAGLPIDGRVGPNTWPATWRVGGATPPPTPPPSGAPPWPGRLLRNQAPMMNGADVRQYQQRMRDRGWQIAVDGWFGPQSAEITRQFQIRQRLQADSIVGPITWAAAFS